MLDDGTRTKKDRRYRAPIVRPVTVWLMMSAYIGCGFTAAAAAATELHRARGGGAVGIAAVVGQLRRDGAV